MAALGWHCERSRRELLRRTAVRSVEGGIALGVVTYLWAMYCIYYNIIVAVGSANSQDYVGRFEVAPGMQPGSVRLVPVATKAIATKRELPPAVAWLADHLPYLSAPRLPVVGRGRLRGGRPQPARCSSGSSRGGTVTGVVVSIDHARLRSLRRSCARRGLVVEAREQSVRGDTWVVRVDAVRYFARR